MQTIYENMANKPWGETRKKLKANGYSNEELDRVKAAVMQVKKERAQAVANYRNFKKVWKSLIDPLTYEMRIATSQAYYWTPERSQEHHDFYLKYKRILGEVQIALIALCDSKGELPSAVAQELGVPNKGEHWTDWVDWYGEQQFPPIKELRSKIQRSYAKLTFKAGRKRKAIMARWTPDDHRHAVSALRTRTEGELASLERVQQVAPDFENEMLISKMKKALDLIDNLTLEHDVPKTWHGLFKE